MAKVEYDHWWYCFLHQQVIDVLQQRVSSATPAILDAGCGTGGLLAKLHESGYRNLSGFDISEDALGFCQDRKLNVQFQLGDIQKLADEYPKNKFDAIISNDTLYFFQFEDIRQILSSMSRVLNTQGIVILNFPALASFSGIHDLSVGVTHRFNKAEIEKLFDEESMEIEVIHYWPVLLSPLIYITRLIQRCKLKMGKVEKIESDITLPNRLVNLVLKKIMWVEQKYLKIKPFGSSIFVVARKK